MASQSDDSSSSLLSLSSSMSDGCESLDGHDGVRIITPKSRTAIVWKYFGFPRQPRDDIDKGKKAWCKICKKAVAHAGGTRNLKNHLMIWHRAEYDELFSNSGQQNQSQPTLRNFTKPTTTKSLPSTSARAKELTLALTEFIAKDLRPISVVDDTGFLNLMKVAEPRYVIPCRAQ